MPATFTKSFLAVISILTITTATGAANVFALPADTMNKTAEHIEKLEREWSSGLVHRGAGVVDEYEAEDIITTDPDGRVTDKTQDKQDMSSGDLKFQSIDLSDQRVRIYGNTAVSTATSTIKATFKGRDISGTYRFTNVWVLRNGKWLAVASQLTKVNQ